MGSSGSVHLHLISLPRYETLIVEVLRWISDRRIDRPARHWRRELLADHLLRRAFSTYRSIRLHSGLVVLAAQLRLEFLQHLGRECVALVPDLDHPFELLFLLRWNAFEGVIEQGWHELRDSLHRC